MLENFIILYGRNILSRFISPYSQELPWSGVLVLQQVYREDQKDTEALR